MCLYVKNMKKIKKNELKENFEFKNKDILLMKYFYSLYALIVIIYHFTAWNVEIDSIP